MTRLTLHSEEMMRRRGVKLEWIEDTLRAPTSVRIDARDPTLKLAFKQISEAQDKWLRVVYRMESITHIIITVFFDRNEEKKK